MIPTRDIFSVRRMLCTIERHWNGDPYVAFTLVMFGFCVSSLVHHSNKSPGVSIGLLAALAAVVSLRPKMGLLEKACWFSLFILLTVLEVHSISANDADILRSRKEENARFEKARTEENGRFEDIAKRLAETGRKNQRQYKDTLSEVDRVLKRTEILSALARKNLLAITGGSSFSFVYPRQIEGDPDGVTLAIHNVGKEALTGVSVKVSLVREEGTPCDYIETHIRPYSFDVGTLASQIGASLPFVLPTVEPMNDRPTYDIVITQQNTGLKEFLYFRRANGHLEYRLDVFGNKTSSGGGHFEQYCGRELYFYKHSAWRAPETQVLGDQIK